MRLWQKLIYSSVVGLAVVGHSFAQTQPKSKGEKSNPIIKESTTSGKSVATYLFPDFFHYRPAKKGDTTWNYEFNNKDLHVIEPYDLKNVDDIDQIKYYICFYQYPYRPGNIVSPPYLSNLLYKFVHPGPDKWIGIDPITSQMVQFKLHKNNIVRTEQLTLTDRETGKKRKVIYKYFKTEKKIMEPGQTP